MCRLAAAPGTALTPLQSTYLNKRRVVEVLVDASLIGASYYWATLIVFRDPEAYLRNAEIFYETLPIVIAMQLVAFFTMGLYRGLWRAIVAADIIIVLEGVVLGMLATQAFVFVYYGYRAHLVDGGRDPGRHRHRRCHHLTADQPPVPASRLVVGAGL